jgi:hypothetical protein
LLHEAQPAIVLFGEPGESAVAGASAGTRGGVLDLPPAGGADGGAMQPVEVQPVVGTGEERLRGEV